jgi:hypothetical protein
VPPSAAVVGWTDRSALDKSRPAHLVHVDLLLEQNDVPGPHLLDQALVNRGEELGMKVKPHPLLFSHGFIPGNGDGIGVVLQFRWRGDRHGSSIPSLIRIY